MEGRSKRTNRKDTATRVMVPMTVTMAEDFIRVNEEEESGHDEEIKGIRRHAKARDGKTELTFKKPSKGQIRAGRATSLLLEAWKDLL